MGIEKLNCIWVTETIEKKYNVLKFGRYGCPFWWVFFTNAMFLGNPIFPIFWVVGNIRLSSLLHHFLIIFFLYITVNARIVTTIRYYSFWDLTWPAIISFMIMSFEKRCPCLYSQTPIIGYLIWDRYSSYSTWIWDSGVFWSFHILTCNFMCKTHKLYNTTLSRLKVVITVSRHDLEDYQK